MVPEASQHHFRITSSVSLRSWSSSGRATHTGVNSSPPSSSSSALPQRSSTAPPARTAILFQQQHPHARTVAPRRAGRPDVTVDDSGQREGWGHLCWKKVWNYFWPNRLKGVSLQNDTVSHMDTVVYVLSTHIGLPHLIYIRKFISNNIHHNFFRFSKLASRCIKKIFFKLVFRIERNARNF